MVSYIKGVRTTATIEPVNCERCGRVILPDDICLCPGTDADYWQAKGREMVGDVDAT